MGIEGKLNWRRRLGYRRQSDLVSNWRDVKYCVIDLETTGLDFAKDEIVSVGATQIEMGRVRTEFNYYREVRPNQTPSPSSIRIHGIRAVDLQDASPMEEVLPDVVERVRGRTVVAHAGWVENGFLRTPLKNFNIDFSRRLIDTAALARACQVVEEDLDHEPSLEHLARKLNLPVYSPHQALGDALTTAVVFLALATDLEQRRLSKGDRGLTLQELLKVSEKYARTRS
jgi:DNA polymerase III subunit epsilon